MVLFDGDNNNEELCDNKNQNGDEAFFWHYRRSDFDDSFYNDQVAYNDLDYATDNLDDNGCRLMILATGERMMLVLFEDDNAI